MIVTLDIETIGNADAVAKMPDPKPNGRLNKDPDKIARDVAEKKAAMITKAALDPLTAAVCSLAEIQQMTDDEIERNFSSAKGTSALRRRGSMPSIVSAGSASGTSRRSSSGAGNVVYVGNVDELARAIAGYSNLTTAEAGSG